MLLCLLRGVPDRKQELATGATRKPDIATADDERAGFSGCAGEADGVERAGRNGGRERIAGEGDTGGAKLDVLKLEFEEERVLQGDEDLGDLVLDE